MSLPPRGVQSVNKYAMALSKLALVGHSNMATTQRYIYLRPAMLKVVFELV